jgi:hypothetical protein
MYIRFLWPTTSAASSKGIYAAATNSMNQATRQAVHAINQSILI